MTVAEVMGIAAAIAVCIVPEFVEFLRFKVVVIICKFVFKQYIMVDFVEFCQGLGLHLLQTF
jgi:hypothetical protein